MSDTEPMAGSLEPAEFDRNVSVEPGTIESVRSDREGLPRGYRMRADAHYVDHLGSRSAGQPVRLVAADEITSTRSVDPQDLRPLIESIRAHGIVHPLLISRSESGYVVIAGHKRLAAARLLRLSTVPCLVHQIDEAQALLLARADNLQAVPTARPDATPHMVAGVHQEIAQHLAVVQASTALVTTSPPPLARAALDLIAAHSSRAARLVDALEAVTRRSASSDRVRSLASVIDRVVAGFAAEERLRGAEIRARIDGTAAGLAVREDDVALIVSSGVMATLPMVEQRHIVRPVIVVAVSSEGAAFARIVIAQTAVVVPAALAERFFDEDYSERSGGWCALACALAVKAVAERSGGSATLDVDSHGYTALTVQVPYL